MVRERGSILIFVAVVVAFVVVALTVAAYVGEYSRRAAALSASTRSYATAASYPAPSVKDERPVVQEQPASGSVPASSGVPSLEVTSPGNGWPVPGGKLKVSGIASPDSKVSIRLIYDGDRDSNVPDVVMIAPDPASGRFTWDMELPRGVVRSLEVTATANGKKAQKVIELKDPAVDIPPNPRELLLEYFGREYYLMPWRDDTGLYSYDGVHYARNRNGLDVLLGDVISIYRRLPKYQVNYFDCTNASAMMWQILTDAGFKSVIAAGKSPMPVTDPQVGHAWVLVYLDDGTVAIEATAYTEGYPATVKSKVRVGKDIVSRYVVDGIMKYQDHPEYYSPEVVYKDIYEAVRSHGSTWDWDWWSKIK